MNDLMKAATRVVKTGCPVVHEAYRSHLDNDARIPEAIFNEFAEAVEDWEGMSELMSTDPGEDEDGPTRNQRLTRLSRR